MLNLFSAKFNFLFNHQSKTVKPVFKGYNNVQWMASSTHYHPMRRFFVLPLFTSYGFSENPCNQEDPDGSVFCVSGERLQLVRGEPEHNIGAAHDVCNAGWNGVQRFLHRRNNWDCRSLVHRENPGVKVVGKHPVVQIEQLYTIFCEF